MPTEKKGTLLWAKVTTLMCKIQLCLNKLLQYLMIFNLQNKSKAVQFYSCFKLKRQLFEYFAYIKHQIYCFFIFWRQVLVSFWHKQENSRNVYIMILHLLLLQLSLFNFKKISILHKLLYRMCTIIFLQTVFCTLLIPAFYRRLLHPSYRTGRHKLFPTRHLSGFLLDLDPPPRQDPPTGCYQ